MGINPLNYDYGQTIVPEGLSDVVAVQAGGRQVHRAAGGTMTDVHLELGGKDATYIRNDADIGGLAADLAEGCFSNSGQSCCSVERIYVHKSVKEKLTEAMVAEAAEDLPLALIIAAPRFCTVVKNSPSNQDGSTIASGTGVS